MPFFFFFFLASSASFYAQIKFSITITSIYAEFKSNGIYLIDSKWQKVPVPSLIINDVIMTSVLLLEIIKVTEPS